MSGRFVCEITVSVSVYEWFRGRGRSRQWASYWSDWMDHYDASRADLDVRLVLK